jgi:hypothetical protein
MDWLLMFSTTLRFVSRHCWILLFAVITLLILACCQSGNGIEIPPESQFSAPALGTPIPINLGLSPVSLPANDSGALIVNNSSAAVRVVISNTITTIEPKAGFLFVLPAGSYPVYIYGLENAPKMHVEKIDQGKIRYVYLMPSR